jgi:hypothetical protein
MEGAIFGLPWTTALFVFGGFLVAVAACIGFAVFFKPTTDRWRTVDDLFGGRTGTSTTDEPARR